MILESVCLVPTAEKRVHKLPELLPLIISKAPNIFKDSKSEEEALNAIHAILDPYKAGGRFTLTLLEPRSYLPASFEHHPTGALLIDYRVTVH